MKTSTITKSALALALGLCATGAMADSKDAAREDFQGDAFANGVNTVATNNLTWADTEGYSAVSAAGKLVVDATTNAPTSATLATDAANSINGALSGGRTASFEAKVAFTPATDTPDIGGSDLRFALYAKAGSGSTNLVVYTGSETVTATEIAANTETTVKVDFTAANTFQVYIGGNLVAGGPFAFANNGTISKVEFAGNGEVDDIAFTYALVDTKITWPTTLSVVSYTVDGEPGDALVAGDGTYTISTEPGAAIVITGTTPYGATVTASGTAGTGFGVTTTTTDLGWYFPCTATAGQDGTAANPYEIDSVNALIALKDAVANVEAARSKSYIQTANIDMASAGAFAGIGAYEKVPTAGTPFLGTYNGQNYKISNVTRAGDNTQGIFNQVGPSGVIENLVVENMAFDSSLSGEYGFAIVGNAGGGATLRNLTAAGTFGSASKPSTHNMAGIVVRLAPGATSGAATTIDSCTNNATIYGAYTKLGGINAIVQNQTGFVDGKVVFVNCANNGTLVCKRTAAQAAQTNGAITGNAGIVGYISGVNVELTGCYSNGEITNADGANTDKDGALVGWTYGGTIKDNGGNSAPSNKKMIGTWGSATETGFLYATVAGGVATTISGSPVAGGSYLLEGNAAPAITLADGESVTFDTSLGYTLTETGIAAATGCTLTDSGTTVRTFSSAYVTVTVTVTGDTSNLNAAWTVNDASAAAPATLTYGDTYAVAFTAAEGYKISDGQTASFSGTAGTENISIAAPLVEALPSYAAGDTDAVAGHTLTAAEASYLNTLVGTAGADAVETALASIDEDDFVAATVLNQDITKADAGSYEFKIKKIAKSGSTVTVTASLVREGTVLGDIRGTATLYTCATPNGDFVKQAAKTFDLNESAGSEATASVTFTDVTQKFFKVVIE